MNIMKRLFAFSLVLFMAPLGQAAITAHQPESSGLGSAKTVSSEVALVDTVSGEVVSADSAKVVIKNSAGSEVTLVINESTKFTKGDKEASLADLKPGVKVTCDVAESEGKQVAKSIQVESEE